MTKDLRAHIASSLSTHPYNIRIMFVILGIAISYIAAIPQTTTAQTSYACYSASQDACTASYATMANCQIDCSGTCVDAATCPGSASLPPPATPSTPGSGTGGPSSPTPGNQTSGPSANSGSFSNPIQSETFADLVQKIANAISAIGIPLVAIFIIWSGFLFVTARGNEQQLATAKKTLSWSLIGGAIIIGAYALAAAVVNFAKQL